MSLQNAPPNGQLPPIGSQQVPLETRAAGRMRKVVEYNERLIRNKTQNLPGKARDGLIWVMTVKTTGAGLAHATANGTPMSGNVEICNWNGTSWVGTGTIVTGWNHSTTNDIPANRFCPAYYRAPLLAIEDPC